MEAIRLQRFLALAGVASRRAAERLIADGEVRVNGRVITAPFTRITLGRDRITVHGRQVLPTDRTTLLVNKPRGVVASLAPTDAEGRPTLHAMLPDLPHGKLAVAGGLDVYAEGVVLVTSDGDLAHALTHPSRPIPKTYHVKIKGKVTIEEVERLRQGVALPERPVRKMAPAEVDVLRETGRHDWLQITTEEGRHRAVQRMLEAIGHEPLKIARIAFGGISYVGVKVGRHRKLTDGEVTNLRTLAGLVDTTSRSR